MKKIQQGFTLIELLVVIAIIGLLASVVLLALNSARSKSRDAKRLADVKQLMSGLELYFNECNSYPIVSAATTLGAAGQKLYTGTSCGTSAGTSGNGGIGTTATGTILVGQLPAAPTPPDGGCSSGNNPYIYSSLNAAGGVQTSSPAAGFQIQFCLGGATGGLSSGIHTAKHSGIQ